MTDSFSEKAINATLAAKDTFCKFLSANDSGETGGHQSGMLISKSASRMLFTDEEVKNNHILKKNARVKWQDDFYTDSCFTWYESKNELRITRFGRGFPLLSPEYTGALFVLAKYTDEDYVGYILNSEEEIQNYLDSFGMTPAETNRIVEVENVKAEVQEKSAIDRFIESLSEDFPSSEEMSKAARMIQYQISMSKDSAVNNPDKVILEWTDMEYKLFRALEQSRYGKIVSSGFDTVDDFISMANQVLNRRKSRAGKSLEHHLEALFEANHLRYTSQGITEGNKKPDFIFPSINDYHNNQFPVDKICTLAAKTTCKDRWRQVLNEADRLRDHHKYLCTLQQGISSSQMDEMDAEGVVLIVPKPYISTYPKDRQHRIWSIGSFISYVKAMEE